MMWDTDAVTQACKGLRKHHLREYGGPKRTKFLMRTIWISAVAQYLWNNMEKELALCLMLSWEFLLRMQSEGLNVHMGDPRVLTEKVEWPAALWIEKDGSLHFWMARRKNKPEGSHLVRSCCCSKKRFCTPCAFARLLRGVPYGAQLWDFRPAYVLARVRQVLITLGIAAGKDFSFKSIRAGRATEMAKEGSTIADILMAGEWRSRAFLRYCDIDAVDPNELLTTTLDNSDGEDVASAIEAA